MCGFAGFLDCSLSLNSTELANIARDMADTLSHRGPDDFGHWVDSSVGIALSHRRLSIIDLSSHGHQPMHSIGGRYVIAYNGEIYNFCELKELLEQQGCVFRGHSDTEVLLAAIEIWGIDQALNRIVGMFAFSLWDKENRVLTLARDRLGEKPLYYGWQHKSFVFASELKALKAHPEWQGEIQRNSVALLMRHGNIPAPYSIYNNILKLMPGTILRVPTTLSPGVLPEVQTYWSAKQVAELGQDKLLTLSPEEATDNLDSLLRDTIRGKMIADVPLGVFLSGGIDSSTVAAMMQAESHQPIKSFSIGFHEEGYNEAEYSKAVARHLGTDHTEIFVTSDQALAVISRLPTLYDEPFSDPSQIPTFLVSELTREHVKVALSGDGGDELFGGYNRHVLGKTIWDRIAWLPRSIRYPVARFIHMFPPRLWDQIFTAMGLRLFAKTNQQLFGEKLHKLADAFTASSSEEMYSNLVSHWKQPSDLVLNSAEPLTLLTNPHLWANLPDFSQRMMFLDMVSYLPDDILTKVDRASMGASLETRVPFLDHRIVEFAWRLPLSMKIRDGQGKWLLRQVLYRYVPKTLMDRPKMGFGVPIDSWLRGPLREWAEELLDESRLRREGFFRPSIVRQKWAEHLSGQRNWQYCLWDVLMFQSWLENA